MCVYIPCGVVMTLSGVSTIQPTHTPHGMVWGANARHMYKSLSLSSADRSHLVSIYVLAPSDHFKLLFGDAMAGATVLTIIVRVASPTDHRRSTQFATNDSDHRSHDSRTTVGEHLGEHMDKSVREPLYEPIRNLWGGTWDKIWAFTWGTSRGPLVEPLEFRRGP